MKFTANQLMGCFQTPLKLMLCHANLHVLVRSTFKKSSNINHEMFVLYIHFLVFEFFIFIFLKQIKQTDLMRDFHYF